MSKELPYFKFYPSEWFEGDITLQNEKTQGLFILICAWYWKKDCVIDIKFIKKRLIKDQATLKQCLNNLIESDIIKVDDNQRIIINFLDLQYDELSEKRKRKVDAGRKGGKVTLKQRLSNAQASREVEVEVEVERKEIYREIIENYKKYCPDMPEIKILTDQRKKAINARIKEHGKETIKQVLEIAGRSDFLNGGNDKKWKANFDWIMKPLNFVKIMEGNYNNNKQHDLSKIDWNKEEREY